VDALTSAETFADITNLTYLIPGMISKLYANFLKMTGEPIAAAMLTLAQVIEQKPDTVALTVKQAAKTLGVSTDAIYDLCASGRLLHERVGKKANRIMPKSLQTLRKEITTGGQRKTRCLR
jgi:excisionase family DNA binding protein